MIFKTSHQKKSAVFTTFFAMLVLFLLFFCGLTEVDEPEEYGVAINFGTSDVGSGIPKLNKTIASSPVKKSEPVPVNKTVVKETVVEDKIATQDSEEAPVIVPKKKVVKKIKELVPDKKKEQEVVKKIEEKKTAKPTKETQNVLNSLFGKKSNGANAESEGDNKAGEGVKGVKDGDPKSNKYYGNNGSGGDGNYLLKGRRALSKPVKKPNCNEEGVVAVRIEVDKGGRVIKAVPGVKGTTNNSPCLLAPAKKAALATKWNPDGNAPSKQIGVIRYKFTLSE